MRRKASMIVLAVLMAAGAIWTAVYDICLSKIKTTSPILDAAEYNGTAWYVTGSAKNCNKTFELSFENGTWMILFEGQAGGEDISYGRGAGCLAFYKGSSMMVQVGVGGGSGPAGMGGGKTTVMTNFAMPTDYTNMGTLQAEASGAGGGEPNREEYKYSTGRLVFDDYWRKVDGTFAGWEGESYDEVSINIAKGKSSPGGGIPANQKNGGFSFEQKDVYGKDIRTPNSEKGAGGGAGYRDGGAGTMGYNKTGTVYNYHDGGGGSCTPWCYPYASSDIQNGAQLVSAPPTTITTTRRWRDTVTTGYAKFHRIDPAVMPGESQSKQYGVDGYGIDGKGVSITPGELGDGRYDPEWVVDWRSVNWGGAEFKCGLVGRWVYSVRVGGEWEGLAPDGFLSDSEKRHLVCR